MIPKFWLQGTQKKKKRASIVRARFEKQAQFENMLFGRHVHADGSEGATMRIESDSAALRSNDLLLLSTEFKQKNVIFLLSLPFFFFFFFS